MKNLYPEFSSEFEISKLLDGMPTESEIMAAMLIIIKGIEKKIDKNTQLIIDAFKKEGETSKIKIIQELTNFITLAFEKNNEVLKDDIKKKFVEFSQTDDWNAKIEFSIPFINLLGVNIKAEFDVKSWAKRMSSKYGSKFYELFGSMFS